MHKKILSSLFVLLFSVLACRPVIAIGWEELLLLFIVIGLLLGPFLYRLFRRIEKFRKYEHKNKE